MSMSNGNQNDTSIIYLIGKPGTGKYTIAKELAKSGFIICDNQLINNPIFTLVSYDGFTNSPVSEAAWQAIGRIQAVILDFIAGEKDRSYVLTNCLYEEDQGDKDCYARVESMALKRGSLFIPVKLIIAQEEHLKRIIEPSRRDRLKSVDPQDVYQPEKLLAVQHSHLLELDVSNLSVFQVAEKILKHKEKISSVA